MGVHFDNIASELSTLAAEVLDTIEAEELAAGGFVSDLEVKAGCGFLRPRLSRMVAGLLTKVVGKYQDVSAGQLVSMIDGLMRETKMEGKNQ